MNLYEYVIKHEPRAERSLALAAARRVNLPDRLLHDCIQEVRIAWLADTAIDTTKYTHKQILNRAFQIAISAATSLWYEMASPVRLPKGTKHSPAWAVAFEGSDEAEDFLASAIHEPDLASAIHEPDLIELFSEENDEVPNGVTLILSVDLDDTERSIVSLLSNGLSADEVASVLNMGRRTVYNHIERIKAKVSA